MKKTTNLIVKFLKICIIKTVKLKILSNYLIAIPIPRINNTNHLRNNFQTFDKKNKIMKHYNNLKNT